MRNFHVAKKTVCWAGHVHDSKSEAGRCDVLQDRLRNGEIVGLKIAPQFYFHINGVEVKYANGRRAGYKGDFTYIEGNQQVVEDVKPAGGLVERDVPLRLAMFRAIYPDIELRIVK